MFNVVYFIISMARAVQLGSHFERDVHHIDVLQPLIRPGSHLNSPYLPHLDIWSGDDADDSVLSSFALLPTADISTLSSIAKPVVQMLGMKASGTNLFLELVKRNIDARVLDKLDLGYSLFWKHSPIDQITTGRPANQEYFKHVLAVAIVRNPFSILSHFFKGGPIRKNMCGPMVVLDIGSVQAPCRLREKAPLWDGGKMYTVNATNAVALWNSYVRNYLDTLPHMGFKNTTVIRFEDLVIQPEVAMQQIAALAEVPLAASLDLPSAPTGPSRTTRAMAVRELEQKSYLSRFQPALRTEICRMLDSELMRRLQYDDCDSHI